MHRKHIDVNEVAEFLQTCGPNTKVYIGCDSERHIVNGVWYADYITAVVIHKDGKHGCKIFGAVERDRDYDQKSSKPRLRLMNEVYRAANLYLALSEVIENDIEVHIDVNPNEMHNSNLVINEAVGYIRGTCNVIPMVKPMAWAASAAADRYKEVAAYLEQKRTA